MSLEPPRGEVPRPQFSRSDWLCLNGPWGFEADPIGEVVDRVDRELGRTINVPFTPETVLSGIADTGFMESVWYRRKIIIPAAWAGKRVILHFGAVDWLATIYLDGKDVGTHRGGSVHFSFDVSEFVMPGETHTLVVHAQDHLRSGKQPGGKQSSRLDSWGCYYARTTGIWQSVWLEATGDSYLSDFQIIADPAGGRATVIPSISGYRRDLTFRLRASLEGKTATSEAALLPGTPVTIDFDEPKLWSPAAPHLYNLTLEVVDAQGVSLDRVASYVGLRSVAVAGDQILLNGEPVYHRFVLDQGFYPEGGWTAPDDAALKRDIELSMAMGFVGARLHQKVFEPRFHAWADRLGYLTWAESPNWGAEIDDPEAMGNFLDEWRQIVVQCRNHPSVIAWTPLNETGFSAGREAPISAQHGLSVERAAALTRDLDPTRPVNDASGWVHRDTDIWTVHSYEQDPVRLADIVSAFPNVYRNAPKNEPHYAGQPYIIDEFGGAAFASEKTSDAPVERTAEIVAESPSQAWGYGAPPQTAEAFEARIRDQVNTILSTQHSCGYCYTQLTDVEQEQNGLLTYDRTPKLPIETYCEIFSAEPDSK
ncbi:glycoside hydrolase family 2 protein [Bauldia sp.]|uniref:glycoside hydrolase family 2 protein n=1 Tax=Bauldia sp. TaxID=2575872 RepID=UPI003BABA7B3